jgi:Flp pilus assembly protein TadG
MNELVLRLRSQNGGAAAVEMALVAPLLLIIMFGSVELGNYFMNEHSLVKAVRDGARFAARQSFTNYTACSGSPGGSVETDTQNVVMYGLRTGTTVVTPNISAADITLDVSCADSVDGQDMLGIYRSRFGGTCNGSTADGCAQVITVSATVPYRSILGSFGFSGFGLNLNASSRAVVTGI